jgi:hypothetical protein
MPNSAAGLDRSMTAIEGVVPAATWQHERLSPASTGRSQRYAHHPARCPKQIGGEIVDIDIFGQHDMLPTG